MFANRSHVMLGHICDQIDWNGPIDEWEVVTGWIELKGWIKVCDHLPRQRNCMLNLLIWQGQSRKLYKQITQWYHLWRFAAKGTTDTYA